MNRRLGVPFEPGLDRQERAALVILQQLNVTRPGQSVTVMKFRAHTDFVGLPWVELRRGVVGLSRRGFLRQTDAFGYGYTLTESGAEAL